ncbi:phosphoglucosamine mutase [Hypnocyclicus thermotrophus]|uniref:Phosphoglucosamine mutase n=1 Tax=Hypnocyclicus thermotrophus TaxID=1627895 RepID=A0AA46I5N4_9FUSO|nr:phosphoglucosamine mutase [Hypnocyclicus thermotrophus]TDT70523.1 phosphoglucosamine mutase [Hypnocyclicus thermotrophus]
MKRKYFGTDGIRGEANKELTVDIALRLGYALGYHLKNKNPNKKKIKLVMGTDTRVSGYMLRSALFAGLTAMGINTEFIGVLPTPGVAYLIKKKEADGGIMISASHNPAKDNGIKIFGPTGFKLPDEEELEIEALMDNIEEVTKHIVAGDKVGKFKYSEDDFYLYRDFLVSTVKDDFSGLKIILDVANGAAYRIAQSVFSRLNAELVVINNIPNGTNINVKCGSTDPSILQKVVLGYQADIGLAYDGDADRLIAVDEKGQVIDGDKIIAILAKEMKRKGELNNNKVVTTVMSNMGFEKYLEENGISLIRANVGDRYVLEKMKAQGLNLGGEQSGHIIMLDYNTTGDGVLTSLQLVQAIKNSGKNLSELVDSITDWPQELINVTVEKSKKLSWDKNSIITEFIKEKERLLNSNGRILVRASGTEPKIRVMVEGKDAELVKTIANEIVALLKKELS